MSKETGGTAFPIVGTHEQVIEIGVTLRDYFANTVLPAVYRDYCEAARDIGFFDSDWKELIASDAYEMADAMLKERVK